MATDLQMLYLKVRIEDELTHGAACRRVARLTGLDPDSVFRALARAKRENERDEKRKKKEAKA